MPAFTTTTVRRLTAATRRTSSSCRPGSASVRRSKPSLSVIGAEPTTTTATSARLAARSASASRSSSSAAGTMPSRTASGPSPSAAGPELQPDLGRPARLERDRGPDLAGPGHGLHRVVGHGGRVVGDDRAVDGQREPPDAGHAEQVRAAGVRPERGEQHDRSRPCPSRCPGGPGPTRPAPGEFRCSAASSSPSASRNSRRRPGSPVTGSRSDPGGRLRHHHPGLAARGHGDLGLPGQRLRPARRPGWTRRPA